MLFPYVECNLRQYMKRVGLGGPGKDNISWLLKQFCGSAKAIRAIHNLSALSKSTPSLAPPTPAQETKSGWHHDLTPENILYFGCCLYPGRMGSKRGTFRIADFGAGKIHTYRSGSVNTKSPNGTLTYEPPEAKSEGTTSRPYDIWSLGCVFLELLIWAILGSRAVETFAEERVDRRYPGSSTDVLMDDSFWQMAVDGRVSIRNSVSNQIELLHEKVLHQEWQSFKEVLHLVSRMLDPDRLGRISALDLWDTLDRIYREGQLDLKRSNRNSFPESSQERASSPLPRLSLEAPDRRSPEPLLRSPLDTHMISLPNRQVVGSISGDYLTSSPTYSPRLSRGGNQRNSSTKEL